VDVTQQKTLERDLLQAQKLESIGQLSAGIAHEINTPAQFIGDNIRFLQETVGDVLRVAEESVVSPVAGATAQSDATTGAALQDFDYLKEEIPKAIQQSLDGVERISRIVSAMKEFSHPAIDLTPYDLNRAILSTITVASNEWKYVAQVETDLDPELLPVVVMPGAFNQVILNMLVNAAHAVGAVISGNPGSKGLIRISTRMALDSVEIRIQDSGCGIPEHIRHRIFDPFFTTKEVGKGTGQGLALAHDVIVNKHHGAIELETGIDAGTTFTIRLPLSPKGCSEIAA
jgi:signal transduction histidine kinase